MIQIMFWMASMQNFQLQIVQIIVQIMENVLIILAFVKMIGVAEIAPELFVQIIVVIMESVV